MKEHPDEGKTSVERIVFAFIGLITLLSGGSSVYSGIKASDSTQATQALEVRMAVVEKALSNLEKATDANTDKVEAVRTELFNNINRINKRF